MADLKTTGEGVETPGYGQQQNDVMSQIRHGITSNPAEVYNKDLTPDLFLQQKAHSNFWNTFTNAWDETKLSQDKGELYQLQKQNREFQAQIDDPSIPVEQQHIAQAKMHDNFGQMVDLTKSIQDRQKGIEARPVDPDYQYKMDKATRDDGVFTKWLDTPGTLAQDAGGMLPYTWQQLVIGGSSIAIDKIVPKLIQKFAPDVEGGPAGALVAAATIGSDAVKYLGGLYAAYQVQKQMSNQAYGDAYEKKLNQILQPILAKGLTPDDIQMKEAYKQADKGTAELEDVNRNMFLQTYAQSILLTNPALGLIGKAANELEIPALYARLASRAGAVGMEGLLMANFMGTQNIAEQKYLRGDYDNYKKGKSFLGTTPSALNENFNILSENVKYLFGAGDDQLTQNPEYKQAVRSGLGLGMLMGIPMAGVETYHDIKANIKSKADAVNFVNHQMNMDDLQFKTTLVDAAVKKGNIDLLNQHLSDIERNGGYKQDDGSVAEVNPEDAKKAQKFVNDASNLITLFNSDKKFTSLQGDKNAEKRVNAVTYLLGAKNRIDELEPKIDELDKGREQIYSELAKDEQTNQKLKGSIDVMSERDLRSAVAKQEIESKTLTGSHELNLKLFEDQKAKLVETKLANIEAVKQDVADVKEQTARIENIERTHSADIFDIDKQISKARKDYKDQSEIIKNNLLDLKTRSINIMDPRVKDLNILNNQISAIDDKTDTLKKTYKEASDDIKANNGNENDYSDVIAQKKKLIELTVQKEGLKAQYQSIKDNILNETNSEVFTPEDTKKLSKLIDDRAVTTKDADLKKIESDYLDFNKDYELYSKRLIDFKKDPTSILREVIAKDDQMKETEPEAQQQSATTKNEEINNAQNTIDTPEPISTDEDPDMGTEYKAKGDVIINIKQPIKSIYNALAYVDKDSGKFESRDEGFSKWISDPKLVKEKADATVEYDLIDENGKPIKPTKDNIEQLVEHSRIRVKVKSGTQEFNKELYVHEPDYVHNDKTNVTHLSLNDKVDAKIQIENEKQKVRDTRRRILTALAKPSVTRVYSKGFNIKDDFAKGHPNRTGKNQAIDKAWNIKPSEIKLYVADSQGGRISSISEVDRNNPVTPGTIYASTTKTCSGAQAYVKLNVGKLTREHAEIVFEALHQLGNQKEGSKRQFKTKNLKEGSVSGSLRVGEVLDLLVNWGGRTSAEDTGNKNRWSNVNEDYVKRMSAKQLFIEHVAENGKPITYLHFGDNVVDLYRTDKKELSNRFVDWAVANKNYKVSMYDANLLGGISLNDPVKNSFKLDSWEYNKDKGLTYAQLLATVPVDGENRTAIQTDVEEYKGTGSLFKDPIASMTGIDTLQVETTNKAGVTKVIVSKPKAEAKEAKKEVVTTTAGEYYVVPNNDFSKAEEGVSLGISYNKDPNGKQILDFEIGKVLSVDGNKVLRIIKGDEVKDYNLSDKATLDKLTDTWIFNDETKLMSSVDKTITETPLIEESNVKSDIATENTQSEWVAGNVEEGDRTIDAKVEKVESTPINLEVPAVKLDHDPLFDEDLGADNVDNKDTLARLVNYAKPYYTKADIPKAVDNLRKMLGNTFSIKVVDDFIKLGQSGKQAFATFQRDCITLAQLMETGTEFHEAYHRVSLLLLDPKDRKSIYNEARSRYGVRGTDRQIEEVLAEKFRDHMIDPETTKPGKIRQFFERIWNWINYSLLKRNPMSSANIDEMFNSIAQGKFRNATVNAYNYEQLGNLEVPRYIKGENIPEIETTKQQEDFINSLTAVVIQTNGVDKISDASEVNYNKLFDYLKLRIGDAKARSTESKTDDERNNYIRLSDLYSRALKNWDKTFYPMVIEKLKNYGLRIKEGLNVENEKEAWRMDDDNYIANFDRNPVEQDQRETVLPNIKYLMHILPESDQPDSFTGMMKFSGFGENWRELLRDLHFHATFDDMLKDVDKKAENSYKWKILQAKLNKSDDIFKNQFYQAVSKARHDFLNTNMTVVKNDNDGRSEITNFYQIDTLLQNEKNNLINEKNGGLWGQMFQDSSIISRREGEAAKINIPKFDKLIDEYKQLKIDAQNFSTKGEGDLNKLQDRIIGLYNSVGINIDKDTLNYRLLKNDANIAKGLNDFLADSNYLFGKEGDLYIFGQWQNGAKVDKNREFRFQKKNLATILGSEGHTKRLAEDYINSHIHKMNDMILGPDNKPYYVYSNPGIVSDTIRNIKYNPTYIDEKLSAINNRGSYILNHLKNNPQDKERFGVYTFSTFRNEADKDSDTDYSGMSMLDDHMTKMLSTLATKEENQHIPFPVLASKRLYYLFKGIPLIRAVDISGDTVKPSSVAIDQFYKYFLDEKNRIGKVLEDVKNAKGDLTNLIENVHYTYDKKTKEYTFAGDKDKDGELIPINGIRYSNFPEFNKLSTDLDNEVAVKERISQSIKQRVDTELRDLEQNGVIKRDTTNKTWLNEKLPAEIVKKWNGDYGKDGIRAMVSHSVVNQIIGKIEVEKLISGDPICYKLDKVSGQSYEDQAKRLSVLASTGNVPVEVMTDKYLKSSRKPYDERLALKSYKVSTLFSNVVKSASYDDLRGIYERSYKREGLSNEESIEKAKVTLQAFMKCDNTDAQAFITPMMYRQIKMRLGEWNDKYQQAFEQIMSGKNMDSDELVKYKNFFMEPLKLVYFDHNLGAGLDTVTYDKMSCATLFPSDVKGKEIEDLYNRMTKENDPVDMLLFDSAVKTGNQKRMSFYENKEGTDVSDFNKMQTYEQDWKGLRRQLLTDPHDEAEHKVSSQMFKVNLLNLNDDGLYELGGKHKTGAEIRQTIFNGLKALSNIGKEKVLSKFGLDKDANAQVSWTNLMEFLREEAEKGNLDDNTISALGINNGENITSLDLLPKKDWIYNRIISFIGKKTVDVNMPGDISIQQSNIGYRTKLTEGKTDVKKSDDLKYYTFHDDGSLKTPMECVVSPRLFKSIIPKGVDPKEFLKQNPEVVGYRIPNQAKSSIIYMKVVGFLPEETGNTIILPTEFTAQTGSDFDIDKLFTLRHNYKVVDGKIQKVDFHSVDNHPELKKIKDEIEQLKTKDELTDAKHKEIEDQLMSLKSFRNMYYGKLKESFANYSHIFLSDKYDEYKGLNESLSKDYEFLDQTKPKIKQYQVEIDKLRKQKADTTDPQKKDELSKVISNNIQKIRQIRKDSGLDYLEESILNNRLKKPELLDKIANELQAIGKFPGKIDFLLADEFEQNTEKAIQNRLLDANISILSSKFHNTEITKPLDTYNNILKQLAGRITEREEVGNLEVASPLFQSKVKQQFNAGKGGTAFAALNNVHHSLAQAVKLGYRGLLDIGEATEEGIKLDRKVGDDGVLISDWMSTLINSFVDIEKDPYIMKLNANPTTYSSMYFMLRSGIGENTFKFLAQPILKKLAYYDGLSKGSISDIENFKHAFSKTRLELAKRLDNLAAQFKIDVTKMLPDVIWGEKGSDSKVLEDGLKMTEFEDTNYETVTKFLSNKQPKEQLQILMNQINILDRFKEYKAAGDKLQELVTICQVDTKKYGSNILETRAFQNRKNKFFMETGPDFINAEKLFDDTHLGLLLDNSINLAENILSDKMLYTTKGFKNINDAVFKYTGSRNTSDQKLINIVGRELYTDIISDFFTKPEYLGYKEEDLKNLFGMNDSKESIAKQVYAIKNGKFLPEDSARNIKANKWLRENKLFSDLLIPEFPEGQPAYLRSAFRKDDEMNTNILTESFKDLITSDIPEVQKLMKDLTTYSYFSSGFKPGMFNIFQYIPTDYLGKLRGSNGLEYNDFLKMKLEDYNDPANYSTDINNRIRNIIKNTWYYNSMVPRIDKTVEVKGKKVTAISDANILTYKDVPRVIKFENMNSQLILGESASSTTGSSLLVYKPFVKYNYKGKVILAEYMGYDKNTKNPLYKTTEKLSMLGNGIQFKENGLSKSFIWDKELPEGLIIGNKDQWYMDNAPKFKEKYGNDIILVPKEDQVLDVYKTEMQKNIVVKGNDKLEDIRQTIKDLPLDKQKKLIELTKSDNIDQVINDPNLKSEFGQKLIEHLITCL